FRKRQKIDHQAEALLCDAPDLRLVGILRVASVDVDQRGDVLDHAGGKPLRDDIPVAFHEDESDYRLQDYHWRDDDEQRARVEALRHDAVEPATATTPAFGDLPEGAVDLAHHGDCVVPLPGTAQPH